MNSGNWFLRHLNWTMIISLVILYGLASVSGIILGLIMGIANPSVSDEALDGYSYLVGFILSLVVLVPVGLWVLERKARSLWNIIWLCIPFGLIVFLALENKRQLSSAVNKISGKGVVISLAATTSVVIGLGVIGTVLSVAYMGIGMFEPTYDTPVEEITHKPVYWNKTWEGLDYELQTTVQTVSEEYYRTHTYIKDETDCNDMVVDIWNMLYTEGITSVIVIGNHDIEGEYFEDCDHAWILIYDYKGASFALEATEGFLIFAEDVENDSSLDQYWEGYFYAKPSDLREDLYWRW